jgi:teichuronic acid biosynthesis glycosyltransferase TuaG
MALVSIVTPAFNSERTIDSTIQSVRAQNYQEWEHLIVDDRSTDATAERVQVWQKKDPRVHLITHSSNKGPAEARNTAVGAAKGKFLAFLDSDDCWLPAKLDRQVAFMTRNKYNFTFTEYRRIGDFSAKHGRLIRVPSQINYSSLLKNTAIATSTVMLDREKIGSVQLTPNFGYDDLILWLDLLKRGHLAFGLHEDLMRYRTGSPSVSHNKVRSAKWVWNIYRKHEKLSIPASAWYFANYGIRGYLKHRQF